jgi:hypothetical protein
VISALGWAAHTVTLAGASRSRWLGTFLEITFPHAVILPFSIYGAAVDPAHPRLCKVLTDRLPPQSLVNRLAL